MTADLPRFSFVALGGLLVGEAFLFASAHYCWFEFNRHKGWTPLIAMAVALAWLVLLFTWIGISRLLRRPAQFGLGTLLALIFVAALPCGWVANHFHNARQRQTLVRRIVDNGGAVDYRMFRVTKGPIKFDIDANGPRSLGDWSEGLLISSLGHDFFYEIGRVRLASCDVIDELRTLPALHYIEVGPRATDADLERLSGFRNLDWLNLSHSKITDDGLKHLPRLPRLKILMLDDVQVTDAGLKHLAQVNDLAFITIFESKVSEQGLDWLAESLPKVLVCEDIRYGHMLSNVPMNPRPEVVFPD